MSLTGFVVFNAFFMFVDLTGRPKWMSQYRIQEERNIPVSLYKPFVMIIIFFVFRSILLATGKL